MLNRISLRWIHYPRSEILAVTAGGFSHAQLRPYALQVGFHDFTDDEGEPVLIAARSSKSELLCVLESAGYEIVSEEIFVAREVS